jgi:hypothetical protein
MSASRLRGFPGTSSCPGHGARRSLGDLSAYFDRKFAFRSLSRMSLPTAFQSVARTLRCNSCIRRSIRASPQLIYPARVSYRQYAANEPPRKKFDLPEEYTQEVFGMLANNPNVMQAMHQVIEAFDRRGMKLDKEPTVQEMWKIMKDKEIISALENC